MPRSQESSAPVRQPEIQPLVAGRSPVRPPEIQPMTQHVPAWEPSGSSGGSAAEQQAWQALQNQARQ